MDANNHRDPQFFDDLVKPRLRRLSASPELISLMSKRWGLGPATAGDIARFWQDMPPEWPTANTTSSKRYLAACHPDADNFIVMIDDTAGLVYVWYWFDF